MLGVVTKGFLKVCVCIFPSVYPSGGSLAYLGPVLIYVLFVSLSVCAVKKLTPAHDFSRFYFEQWFLDHRNPFYLF